MNCCIIIRKAASEVSMPKNLQNIISFIIAYILIVSVSGQTQNLDRSENTGNKTHSFQISEFDYYIENTGVVIYWTTNIERNSFLFEVERQTSDYSKWERRGYVVASGFSDSVKKYSFWEDAPIHGSSTYRLKLIDINEKYEYSGKLLVNYSNSILKYGDEKVNTFSLSQNFPNPFNPYTKITYYVPDNSKINLSVYNSVGELIIIADQGIVEKGTHIIEWNASNYPSGIYLLRMIAETTEGKQKYHETRKMLLLK